MIRKLTMVCIACFMSFAGVFAFDVELKESSAPVPALVEGIDGIRPSAKLSPYAEALLHPKRLAPLPPEKIDSETLWLARAIFSETKRPEEQLLVAWVIRNRVETRYRGKRTYETVVLDPFQFSAFQPGYPKRPFYVGLTPDTSVAGWQRALRIAHAVRSVDGKHRPFSIDTRHFYSARSMPDYSQPKWADQQTPVKLDEVLSVDKHRFQFFAGIS